MSCMYMLTYTYIKDTNYFHLQVLSESVAKAIQQTQGHESEETVRFITMFDQFFDCFNVRSYNAGKLQRKPFKQPYRSGSDFRLKVRVQICTCTHICTFSYFVCRHTTCYHIPLLHHICSGLQKHSYPTLMSGKAVRMQDQSSAGLPRTKCCCHQQHC